MVTSLSAKNIALSYRCLPSESCTIDRSAPTLHEATAIGRRVGSCGARAAHWLPLQRCGDSRSSACTINTLFTNGWAARRVVFPQDCYGTLSIATPILR
eukprot:scaffold45757_cov68-Phaeocystis_antarctica.AAC.2